MAAPKLVLDTNVIIGAFERHERDCRSIIEAGKDGRAVLGVSLTLDDELHGTEFANDALWPYVTQLPRMARPSARLDRMRLDEGMLDYGGLGGALAEGKGDRQVGRNMRDEEHIEGADAWGADGFVTSEIGLLERNEMLGVRIVSPSEAVAMIEPAAGSA